MQRSNEILNELEQLSMVVAGISRNLPYQAPEGYFSEFPGKCLARLDAHSPDAPGETPNPNWGKGPAMSIPEGYFEGFASRMMDKIRAQESDPSSPLLDSIGKTMPYEVPEAYFETSLPSPLLFGLNDKPVYEAPEGYFETLSGIIMARVQPRVIRMNFRKTWKYAAAAVMAGVILTFGWMRLQTTSTRQNNPPVAALNVAQDLANVSDQDIENYVDDHTQQIQQVQQEEDFANSTASLDISDNDAKNLLGDVPDGELAQYMEEHGSPKDYPTN
jgi:hypothetical protein